jgi:uncharacterized membrane protein SpoIIM required for sporulation
MNQSAFEDRYRERWQAFERGSRPYDPLQKKESAAERAFAIEEFPERYREICRHYALARDRGYTTALIDYLHGLVHNGHHALYAHKPSGGRSFLRFFMQTLPCTVRAEWRVVAVAALSLFGPWIICQLATMIFPEFAYRVLSANELSSMERMYSDSTQEMVGRRRGASDDVMMWGHYIANNTGIDFKAFAGGMLFGLGTLAVLGFNGVVLGTVSGHLTNMGHGENFWSFVSGHSSFELLGFVLAGAAGYKLGYALYSPGNRTRIEALKHAAQPATRLIFGAAVLTILAAFVEGFWSPQRFIPNEVKYAVGIGFWVLWFVYFGLAGSKHQADFEGGRR